MAAILAQDPLVAFRLLCGKVSRDFPLNMAKIGIASANRDQSPISVVSLFGERGLLGHARQRGAPRRDDKSAIEDFWRTRCSHRFSGRLTF